VGDTLGNLQISKFTPHLMPQTTNENGGRPYNEMEARKGSCDAFTLDLINQKGLSLNTSSQILPAPSSNEFSTKILHSIDSASSIDV
jgi:hypothetical protein